ncbi:VCBS repeat-containing protein [Rhodocaloribacter litoris]|uniref:VCBS repeat-containing protein n=1 Tax=Rhodocaloribacter litoris TaxID=2558931 RepID=UPI001E34B376|nr:VCBS repeat-containing protein [Rhodocaloribacter litoris]QXD16589.1 VCBS repeat-containing protein [Rhodocaloribacter litoris]
MSLRFSPLFFLSLMVLAGCAKERAGGPRAAAPAVSHRFTLLPPGFTRIDFENRLTDTDDFNVFTYRNYYDGGGVGLGDFNGDGLLDVYLTANQLPNRLYLNRGDFLFEDVTDRAGVGGRHRWSTGVAVADVNGDGWLDLYVLNSGDLDDRANELYLNRGPDADGIPRFDERAAEYGLDDRGYGTHAAFFDYDRDGDLDVYVMNNSSRPISSFRVKTVRHVRHDLGGDRLYRNDGGRFTDVSEEAGIHGSEIGFGLAVTAGDVDGDGWVDLYLSNDFFERDYLYLNNRDGTFREVIKDRMPHISQSSMGADMADLNNDGLPEIYVTDMLPEDDLRLKTTSTFDDWRAYEGGLASDFYHQLMRNMLHRNNGDGTFSEIGLLAGVAATDWSWSALLQDFDLDGHKDIFVTNGVYKDLTDQDFIMNFSSEQSLRDFVAEEGVNYPKLLAQISSSRLPNYLFQNRGDWSFVNRADDWGLATPGWSNGAAYGDLDGDGDLDLVVNNLNMPAFVYRNETDSLDAHRFLQVALEGEGMNRFGIGAKVFVRHDGQTFYLEQIPTRGFQSSVDPVLTFGLGTIETVDTLLVVWPDGRGEVRTGIPTNQRLTLRQREAPLPAVDDLPIPRPTPRPRFTDVTAASGLDFVHRENDFIDFRREPMLPWKLSTEGPALAVGDVDGDGLDDVFVGGAKEQAGALYRGRPGGTFARLATTAFDADAISEDVDAAFFDADGDGDLDLYVVSGGNEYGQRAPALLDRLYLNDGHGAFTKAYGRLPDHYESGSVVAPADVDGDGDLDLFVGSRSVPWRYGETPRSALLVNDGRGGFTDRTDDLAPDLARVGMVTDAVWADVDGDGRPDLVVAGEWMPVTVFRNTGGRLARRTGDGLERTHGLWTRLLAADLDGDGDTDLVAGNHGLNSKLRATPDAPLTMHVHDFDRNGWVEQILSVYRDGRPLPLVLRRDLVAHIPFLAERFPTHRDYAGKTVEELFTEAERAGALVHTAYELRTVVFENTGGAFRLHPLPFEAQLAPMYGLLAGDFDDDGHTDLLLGGNFFGFKPDLGRMDASYGVFLRGDGALRFETRLPRQSGFFVPGQTRRLARANGRVLVARNDDAVQVFEVR